VAIAYSAVLDPSFIERNLRIDKQRQAVAAVTKSRFTMKPITGHTRTMFLLFFGSHIPITLLMDGQAALPSRFYPQFATEMLTWYTTTFNDKLMTPPCDNIFFKSFIWCELLFQLPFFFLATHVLYHMNVSGNGWFRSICMIYGAHTCTTLVPILASILSDTDSLTVEKAVLLGFYLPYLIFPAWLMLICFTNDDIFGNEVEPRANNNEVKPQTNEKHHYAKID
jgi:hypothetical protein